MIDTMSARGRDASAATPEASSDLAPWTPQLGDAWDHKKAAHLLRRAGFGYTQAQLKNVIDLGMDQAVETLLNADTAVLPTAGSWTLPSGETLNLALLSGQRGLWLHECINGQHPLKEKMVLFWADHFSVGAENDVGAQAMIAHTNIFRLFGLGSFKDMLVAVTADPAMQLWLDNYLNGQNLTINENYSRELLELYTMGVYGGYTEFDVVECAKCLSGWSLNSRTTPATFLWRPTWHLPGPKTVLGRTVHNPGDPQHEVHEMLDVILDHASTGTYVATKIWEFFVAENPDRALMQQLGAIWKSSGYDIKTLMRTILKSRYFYSDASIRTLIKNPVEFVTNLVLNTESSLRRYNSLGTIVEFMGWPLLRYTNPAGLDDGMAWINSQTLIGRANFANTLTQVGGGTVLAVFNPRLETQRNQLLRSKDVVDWYAELFVQSDVPPLVRWTLEQFIDRNDSGPVRFVPNTAAGDLKMRGFVHLMGILPEYNIN